MKKRILLLLVTLIFIITSCGTTFAENPKSLNSFKGQSLLVDGKTMDISEDLFKNAEGTMMYPLRGLAERLGFIIDWDAAKRSVIISSNQDQITFAPDTQTVIKNEVKRTLTYDIEIKDSRIYVPVQFIIEVLGIRAEQNPTSKTVDFLTAADTLESFDLSISERNVKDQVMAYLTSLELNRDFSGQILVEQDGKILIDRSYGLADYEDNMKALNSTTFAIGSVTKQFTAAAIVQLVEKNKLSYEDKVSKYLMEVPFGDQITIHQLLTHTSGLFNFTNAVDLVKFNPTEEAKFEELMLLIKEKELDFEPGTSWSYSNTGYLILGKIVEDLSGLSLEQYFQTYIFEPVGMEHTSVSYRLAEKIVKAKGYTGFMDIVPDPYDAALLNIAYGSGYLCSTAEDLYKWDKALQEGNIVSKDSLATMFGKQAKIDAETQYGYGWFIGTGNYGVELFHGGNTIGFTSENAMYPDENAHIIILTNKGYANLSSIKKEIVTLLSGKAAVPLEQRGNYTIPTTDKDKYTGKYKLDGADTNLNITNLSGELILNFSGINCRLVAETKNNLYSRDYDIDLKYTFGPDGIVTGIVVTTAGQSFECIKAEVTAEINISEEQMQKYVGSYEVKNMIKFDISIKDGNLIFQGEGQPSFEVLPISQTKFESALYGIAIEFNSMDKPTECIIYQMGMEFKGIRIK